MRALLATTILLIAATVTTGAQDLENPRMRTWATALGVGCEHCHVSGRWADGTKPAYAFAVRMMRMVNGLNAGPLKDVGSVTCWSCHRGRTIPARLPRAQWQRIQSEHASEFTTQPDLALGMSVYAASLGVTCAYCHDADRGANTKTPKATVARMLPIFDEIPKYFDETRQPVTQCYMCHQGKPRPEREP